MAETEKDWLEGMDARTQEEVHRLHQEQSFTEAEELGLVVMGTLNRVTAERDAARDIAVYLEQDLAAAVAHLKKLVEEWPETSWALDSHIQAEAEDFLASLQDPDPHP